MKKTNLRKAYSILSIAAGVFISHQSLSFADAASCETVEANRTYMSGSCPADHSFSKGDTKTQLSFRCEMMANDDFIVSEVSKVTTCESAGITAASAPANTTRSLAGTTVTN